MGDARKLHIHISYVIKFPPPPPPFPSLLNRATRKRRVVQVFFQIRVVAILNESENAAVHIVAHLLRI